MPYALRYCKRLTRDRPHTHIHTRHHHDRDAAFRCQMALRTLATRLYLLTLTQAPQNLYLNYQTCGRLPGRQEMGSTFLVLQ